MKGNAMYKLITLVPVALLSLSACSTGTIAPTKGESKISGTIKQGFQAKEAEIALNGKVYRGKWVSEDPTKEQLAQTTLPHKKHLNQVSMDLKADDGAKMICKGQTHGLEGDLTCSADGKDYPVTLK
jgi:hypothetical protein